MFGLFGKYGRSQVLRAMDTALRAVNVHPNLVPEAVKLTTVRLLRDDAGGRPADAAYGAAAALLGYCLVGREMFIELNDARLSGSVETRIETAAASGEGVDANLLLLALHANLVRQGVVDRFGLEAVSE